MRKLWLVVGMQCAGMAFAPALDIVLNPAAGMDPNALSGFQLAAKYWESKLTNPVAVNIDVGFSALGPNILGQSGSSYEGFWASDVLGVLDSRASSANDLLAVSNFPALSAAQGIGFLTQANTEGGSKLVSLDNNDSRNNVVLALTSANARALGWDPGSSTYVDATITFSSSFPWDFDQRDGVGAGLQDFVGVAIHEMGHAFGFVSGVDDVDYYITHPLDLDGYAVFSTLDLFRYSAPDKLDLAAGDASYFSLDGGKTNLGLFSTGTLNGDGRQASHWKDNLGLGIMDPTANPAGQANTPSELDLIAFDVIGWDLIPEPSSGILLAAGLLCCLTSRRR